MSLEVRTSDLVVVGCGVAGLAASLHCKGRTVTVLGKSAHGRGGASVLAQGGMAVAVGDNDSPARHAADTCAVGCGLCDPQVAELVTGEGPRRLAELLALGVRLDRGPDGHLALGQEAAHSRRRVLHAAGDASGAEVVRTLVAATQDSPNIRFEEALALELIVDQGRVIAVLAWEGPGFSAGSPDHGGQLVVYAAPAVVLASGGIGQIFQWTTNPAEATGDGLAMAARAGAGLAGVEMVQFHPTALMPSQGSPAPEGRLPLLTEALRGEGARLVDEQGRRFMKDIHPLAELAPRDVVARSIWRLSAAGHRVFLDATDIGERFGERFPTVFSLCREHGLDPITCPLPVGPAAHYHMGGVEVDERGRTTLDGLWACGEVAFSGLHGANRLASNSLLEALVFGSRVGEDIAARVLLHPSHRRCRQLVSKSCCDVTADPWFDRGDQGKREIADRLRETMWRHVGLERNAGGMQRALGELRQLASNQVGAGELANMLTVAELVTRAALARTESRGAHYRNDFPHPDRHWQQNLFFRGQQLIQPRPILHAA